MATKAEADALPAKIKHRGIFIERQLQGATGDYKYICHTGISKFLPDLYDTQQLAVMAVDFKADSEGVHEYIIK